MAQYASNTNVSVLNSQAEIQTILRRFGAKSFGTMEEETETGQRVAYLMFTVNNLRVQFDVELPNRIDFKYTETGRDRSEKQIDEKYELAIRRKWRALTLMVKAKLVGVDESCATIEKEFMAYVMLPNGKTIGESLVPKLQEITSGQLQLTSGGRP